MAFTFEVTGMEDLIAKMAKLPDKGADVAALALYEGAAIMADAVSRAVQGIATEKFHYTKFRTDPEDRKRDQLRNELHETAAVFSGGGGNKRWRGRRSH